MHIMLLSIWHKADRGHQKGLHVQTRPIQRPLLMSGRQNGPTQDPNPFNMRMLSTLVDPTIPMLSIYIVDVPLLYMTATIS